MRPRLRLLNGFALQHGDQHLVLRPGSERLLAFLALADKAIERPTVAFRLWPEKTENRAIANLRSALWRIRQLATDLVEATPTHVRLHPAVWVDARDGLAELKQHDPRALGDEVQEMALQGDLLPDWYDDWLLTERERLRQLRLHALEEAVQVLIHRDRLAAAIDLGLRAVAMEPLRESSHRLVIRAHLREGNRAEALRQYEACSRLLRDELGVAPSPQMTSLLSP
ncbi:MAG TPA: BTAD domain-containing putative transcriptional regulator [Acidimicrobiales bacterium]|nr:BTAD domain-containing putative transcriptional regulator [Acidimicrobiales bacterium]